MQTANDYLDEVYRVIRENFTPTDPTGGMTAAAIGYLVKLHVTCEPAPLGFPKFKDVLDQLEERGLVRIGLNAKKALSVWLLQQPDQPPLPTAPPRAGRRFRPLRKAVWLAFVTATSERRRFFNRITGEVKMEAESGLEADPSWVEIVPVDNVSAQGRHRLPEQEQRQFRRCHADAQLRPVVL